MSSNKNQKCNVKNENICSNSTVVKNSELNKPYWMSKCCNADVILSSSDEGTNYFVCTKCGLPCDFISISKNYTNMTNKQTNIEQKLENILDDFYELGKKKHITIVEISELEDNLLSLLQSQKSQLIDEIVGLVDECHWISGTHFVINGKQEKMISKEELKTKLLIKKEEI